MNSLSCKPLLREKLELCNRAIIDSSVDTVDNKYLEHILQWYSMRFNALIIWGLSKHFLICYYSRLIKLLSCDL